MSEKESLASKTVFVTVFFLAAIVSFLATGPVAAYVRQQVPQADNLLIQVFVALALAFPIFVVEEKVIWRVVRKTVFSTIHPVSMGFFVGYVLHYIGIAI